MIRVTPSFIYIVFYFIIHGIYSVFEYVSDVCLYLYNKTYCFYHMLNVFRNNRTQSSCKSVLEISKIPRHVTVLLGDESPSYHFLSNLVMWCLAAGIPFISFYDCEGELKNTQSELEYEIDKRRLKECSIIWHSDPSIGYKNGYSGRKIHVKLLSFSDGKNAIVNMCKQLALSENTDFSIDNISACLHKQYEFPDPDLGIYCGQVFSLFNYPPWQVRLTEFLNLRSCEDVTFQQFTDLLVKFNRCDQRLGKSLSTNQGLASAPL